MKNAIIAIIISAAFAMGFQAGIQHAIEDSYISIEQSDAEQVVLIDLDGNLYEHLAD